MILDLFPDAEPSITLDFLKSKKLDPRITFSRAIVGGAVVLAVAMLMVRFIFSQIMSQVLLARGC